jgi:hypothetical protein
MAGYSYFALDYTLLTYIIAVITMDLHDPQGMYIPTEAAYCPFHAKIGGSVA